MSAPTRFLEKSPEVVRREMVGFPDIAVQAALDFRTHGSATSLSALLLAMLSFYRPKHQTAILESLPPETRFREDLGIDSLTLTEMVFKLDELLGVPIELREVAPLQTLGELQDFLRIKLEG